MQTEAIARIDLRKADRPLLGNCEQRFRSFFAHKIRTAPYERKPRLIRKEDGTGRYLLVVGDITQRELDGFCKTLPYKASYGPVQKKEEPRLTGLENIQEISVPRLEKGLEAAIQKEEPQVEERKTRGSYRLRIKYSSVIPAVLKVLSIMKTPMTSFEILEQLKLDKLDLGYPTLLRRLNGMEEHGLVEYKNRKYTAK